MNAIETQIERFAHLSPDEQREVEAYVAAHPEWEARLEEVRTLGPILDHAHRLQGERPDAEALAYHLYAQQTSESQPKPIQDFFDRISGQLAKDADLQAEQEAVAKRLAALEAASDATAQFERLTGQKLQETPSRTSDRRSSAPTRQRQARIYRLHQRGMRWAVAAVLAFGGLYGVVFLASNLSQTEAGRLAQIAPDDARILLPQTVRSGEVIPDSVIQASPLFIYNEGVDLFEQARTTRFLGFFPAYNAATLDSAAVRFITVLDITPPDAYEALEAHFMLGRIYLLQGNTEAARTAFERVVEGGGNKIRSAERILDRLD